ncbi:hypothetical protein LTR29_013082 [Friedmanniomyces endolithicus]|nr:hypothetical protein LTR29_013082 [Friedmanniomyces endolithicus]
MPPRATTITYGPLDAAPEQTRFSHRRKTVRQPALPPPLPRHQSTLTQVEWIDTPSSNSSHVNVKTNDSFSDAEDDEYYVPDPRSKAKSKTKTRSSRKRLEKTESQPSFTQAIRSAPARMAKRALETDDQGFQIWHDPDDPADTPIERTAKRRKRRAELAMLPTDAIGSYDAGYRSRKKRRGASPEIAESSQLPVNRDDSDGLAGENARPGIGQITPRHSRFKEIPSSQSPASVQLSTQRSQRYVDAERTPLKARDSNSRSPMKRPRTQKLQAGDESQMFARKMLMSMETQPQDRSTVRFEEEQVDSVETETTPKPLRKNPPSLVRMTTVPDSTDTEDDDQVVKQDTERPTCTLTRVGTVQESQSEPDKAQEENGGEVEGEMGVVAGADQRAVIDQMPPMPPPQPRPRKLKRVVTVQDSQCDDMDLELLDGPTEHGYDGMAEVENASNTNEISIEDYGGSVAESEEADYSERDSAMKEGKLEQQGPDAHAAEEVVEVEVKAVEKKEVVEEEMAEYEPSEAEGEQCDQAFYEDATYDPAYSALDRDAARFALITQTQGLRPKQQGSNDGRHDKYSQETINEEHYHDRDPDEEEYIAAHQLSQELRYAAEAVVPSSQPAEKTRAATTRIKDSQPTAARRLTSSEAVPVAPVSISHPHDAAGEAEERIPSSPPPAPLAKRSLTVAREPEVSLQLDSAGVQPQEEERVPSSPPPLRASQVSTVVPTQYSLARPTSRRAGATQTQWSFCSPRKTTRPQSQEGMMMMGSSSPVQLPPWSSPERARYTARLEAGGGTGELVMGSMVDFSLPPPPPISSSRAGTQSGGRSSPPLPM